MVKQVKESIREVNAQGTTVLVVGQNARAVLKIADRAYVEETGQATMDGPVAELAAHAREIDAHLGG